MDYTAKEQKLIRWLRTQKRVAVAFSGGSDSTVLLWAAQKALGRELLAVTVRSGITFEREVRLAAKIAAFLGVKHKVLHVPVPSRAAANPPDRCYHCKKAVLSAIRTYAKRHGFLVLADGSHRDDVRDHRPGKRAVREAGVRSPLAIVGWTKQDTRRALIRWGRPEWFRPAQTCLATRFAFGERLTGPKLRAVREAEEILRSLGFLGFRVRYEGERARLEVLPDDFERICRVRRKVAGRIIRRTAFKSVVLDLLGYRQGAMNRRSG